MMTFDSRIELALKNAVELFQQGRLGDAENAFRAILKRTDDSLPALYFLGEISLETNRAERAVKFFKRAIRINGKVAIFHNNLARALQQLNHLEDAIRSYDRAIELDPNYANAYFNRGIALRGLGRLEQAVRSYDKAIALNPRDADSYNNKGIVFEDLNRFDEALDSYNNAISKKRDFVEAYCNRANALKRLGSFEQALHSYERAIKLKPDNAEALYSHGIVLHHLRRFEESLRSFNKAIQLKPDYAKAYFNRGNTLAELRRFERAIDSYDQAINIKSDIEFLMGELLITKMKICDWSNYAASVVELSRRVSRDEKVAAPFRLLAVSNSPALQRKSAEMLIRTEYSTHGAFETQSCQYTHQRIRVGYFSSDFHNHATAFLMAELFERHDRAKFESIAFSFGPETGDDMRLRLRSAFDKFVDVRNMSDRDVVLLAKNLEIDVGVDLNGFAGGERTNIFAMRAAPVQASYLGYPGTMGADYIDYLIADSILIPASHRQFYTEKIVYLPNSYQPNDRKRRISDKILTRSQAGLPQTGFVFCCFNNNYKITPDVFESWMQILLHVEGSVLWLLEDNELAARNLKKEASVRGVDPDRLIFAPRIELADHLARHRTADLFLDTLPHNAHTTASDALWAGLPVVTQIGETFAGRVAASLLNAVQLPELITTSRDDYVALAVELAANSAKLAAIKRRLEDNLLTAPLFDTELLARHIEVAYTMMVERYRANLPPDHIYVPR